MANIEEVAKEWKNKIFCPAPFLNAYINLNNKALRPCCMTPAVSRLKKPLEEGKQLSEIQQDFWNGNLEAWNHYPGTGETLVDIRKDFLEGKWPKACNYCKVAEENQNWFDSVRIGYIHKYIHHFKDKELESLTWDINEGTKDFKKPIDVDLRPGNTCNFKCMTCSSIWSNQWQKEIDKNPELQGSYFDQESRSGNVLRQPPDWDSDEYNIYKTFDLSGVKWLKISGGESLIDKNVYRIFQKFVESNTAKDTYLKIITNCSQLPTRMQDVLQHFAGIEWRLSIDAVGDLAEYVRYGTKWSETKDIIHRLIKMDNTIGFGFNSVLSMYNIFQIKEWMKFTYDIAYQYKNDPRKIKTNFTHPHRLVEPRYMSISMLDDDDKDFIRSQWKEFVYENNIPTEHQWPFNSIEDEFKVEIDNSYPVETDLNKKFRSQNKNQNLIEFKEKTLLLDKIRGTDIRKLVPQLVKYLE